ncbi:disease resistance protein RPP13 [Sorghum bicolor]|uniref:AAA+ ATPase domain-containing protein n=1 Tax=Sorghum bicolor TaxID=4558 RepID=A0A1Z5RHJ5_SORBI|nr:disease resistance protein RPP13 [Sorghum bicolor]XP_021317151.1 disease resistance protein RPP13 [Sorghum bicolor]XP_021317152.1 disease resistance protein RPP13 [Sorghum bicolor]OQU83206.1 hypothetical protein SORBI_3005G092000 [Sorghum bicolor]OQU83208.1 hypothetical protein SORBI_3005G092000 [Sorghum bicolor]|eukprot:XP_021317150.1 disease resistance protein RPP13 [Sorghum bicolor]
MAEVMASAAAGVMGSVIGKLGTMLTEKYKLAKDVERGIRFLQEELSTMDAVLQMLADKDDDQIDPLAKDWRSKVRELSYDIEDCIDRFMLNHSHGGSKANFVRKAMRKVKTLFEDGGIAEEIQELKSLVSEQSERGKRYYDINQCLAASAQPVLLDPRAPALFQEAMDLVGVDAPREEIIQLLKCEEQQHKVVSIYGIGGQGKTTLAMEVYHKITEVFDCRAFVSVSQTPDMKTLLRDILSQISKSNFDSSERMETDQQLIRTVRQRLMDKRYFILIDDIWSVSAWELLRSALPLNNNGSRIITTTRVKAVANSCCTGIAAQMYEAKPLNDDDSQRLFFKRLFFSSDDCHPDLRKVCSDILKKCSGLPLAIISIAGLLANRSKTLEVWNNVLRSISAAVDKDSPIDKMKRILLLSYFDLPHHLKSCLLYLSVFPEDFSIDCRELILLWVAEGLIPGQDRESMEQLGRSYLNELINRSLVQPTKVGVDGTNVKQCRVHDVILEFIVSKAVEDNFVTIWNGDGFSRNIYSSNKIRRLSIRNVNSAQAAKEIARTIKNGAHIRSINVYQSDSYLLRKHASEFLNSQVLRVLAIGGIFSECNLGHVKSFGQLKYLGAGLQLTEDAQKLQHLETLDLSWANLESIPTCITQLHKLVRLLVRSSVHLPDEIRNLQALEELSRVNLGIQSIKFIQGLGDLTNLKVLEIEWLCSIELRDMKDHKEACISTVSRLFSHLRELRVLESDPDATCLFNKASYVPAPPPLQKLVLYTHIFNRVCPQISSLVNLSRLHIKGINIHGDVGKEGINMIASLPVLLSLTFGFLSNDEEGDSSIPYPRHAISRQGFQRLVKFNLCCGCEALEFEPGAMPKLQMLKLRLMARCQFKFGEGGLLVGLQNLGLGLKHVAVDVNCHGAVADEVEALEDGIRGAAAVHPNCPILQVERRNQIGMAQGCSRRPSDHAEA